MPSPLPFPDAEAPVVPAEPDFLPPPAPRWRTYALHLLLFAITLVTTTLAGAEWMTGKFFFFRDEEFRFGGWFSGPEIRRGLWFSLPFLGVLTVHEFGHYFTARYHRVRATLPYYIPFFTGAFNTIGTFGAVIRIKDQIFSRREFFNIGLAGPLAGFLVAVPVLMYGLTHLPPLEYLYQIRSNYVYADGNSLALAKPLVYRLLETWLADPARLPHPNELMHYPVLLAGLLALFFTALNLLPIGQLDGGHILYGLLGHRRFNRLSFWLFLGFIFYAGLGLFTWRRDPDMWLYGAGPYALYLFVVFRRALPTAGRTALVAAAVWAAQLATVAVWPTATGNPGWLVFGFLLGRVTGIFHPAAPDERPLTAGQKVLGWVMLLIFVLCFTPAPFQ